MAKRLSEKQKEEIIILFTDGKKIEELAKDFNCTKLTISRNLKKNLGEKKYKEIINNIKSKDQDFISEKKDIYIRNNNETLIKNKKRKTKDEQIIIADIQKDFNPLTPFVEIIPLDYEIENGSQKDLSSVPLSEINFPKIVYMIVDKKIELQIKYLKDYPEWNFLSQDELKRKTIQIYFDLKIAKRFCNNDQKVIKVPNTNVFNIVAPILLSRGISRIVSEDKLISL